MEGPPLRRTFSTIYGERICWGRDERWKGELGGCGGDYRANGGQGPYIYNGTPGSARCTGDYMDWEHGVTPIPGLYNEGYFLCEQCQERLFHCKQREDEKAERVKKR